jgi:hypothetical protein
MAMVGVSQPESKTTDDRERQVNQVFMARPQMLLFKKRNMPSTAEMALEFTS